MKYKINYDFDCSKSQAIFEVDHRVTKFESWDVMFLVRGSGKPGGRGTRPYLGISVKEKKILNYIPTLNFMIVFRTRSEMHAVLF